MSDSYWEQPIAWDRQAARTGNRPRVFCASTADWADDEAPAGQRDRLFELIRKTPRLDWLLLTKRAKNISKYLPQDWGENGYPNVWLGVTVENTKHGLPRIDVLRKIPAVCRFLSCEPLLEDLGTVSLAGIHWVIVGGETGRNPSKKECGMEVGKPVVGIRPMDICWAESLIKQCQDQHVAPWFKQLGKLPVGLDGESLKVLNEEGKRSSNGADWDSWPESLAHLRVRETPDFRLADLGRVEASLIELAKDLNLEQAAREKRLRPKLLKTDEKLFQTRQDRAKIIKEYHVLYNPLRKWADFCRAVDLPKRTAYDLLKAAREGEANRAESARLAPEVKPERTPQDVAQKAKTSVDRLLKGLSEENRQKALEMIMAAIGSEIEDHMGLSAECSSLLPVH